MSAAGARYRAAARAYLAYGIVYLVGGLYLISQGVGVAGSPATGNRVPALIRWTLTGLVPLVLIPFLLRHPRPWFERWILSRRDFARILVLFLAFRAYKVGEVALRSDTGSVPAPWGGVITFRAGAVVFLVVTVAALAFIARAAWQRDVPLPLTATHDRMKV